MSQTGPEKPSLELGAISDPEIRRAFETILLRWPVPLVVPLVSVLPERGLPGQIIGVPPMMSAPEAPDPPDAGIYVWAGHQVGGSGEWMLMKRDV